MLETPYASNSWALGPLAQAHGPLGPGPGPRPRGGAWVGGGGAPPGPGPKGHGPRAHELEAYGVSSIQGF